MIFKRKKKTMEVRLFGDHVLASKAKPVGAVNSEIREIAEAMINTMYEKDGVGLAATQVGIPLRIVTLHVELPSRDDMPSMPLSPGEMELCGKMPLVLINPEIVSGSEAKETAEEGCLSVPKLYAPVERPLSVVLKSQLLDGPTVTLNCGGLLGRALQHEIDHLNGIVYIQRVKSPDFENILPEVEKIIKKSGAKNFKIKRLV